MTLFGRVASISTTLGAAPDFHRGLRITLLVGLLVVAQLWGCGKKGPPLAPFVRVPAPMTELVVRRFGDEVSVGFTLPTQNRDGTEPADLVRVDVYAMTTQPRVPPDRTLDLEEFEESATLVASLEVRPRLEPATAEEDPSDDAPVDPRPVQGFPVVISETLVAATLMAVDPWEEEREEEADGDEDEEDVPAIVPLMTPPLPGPLQREYVVVGVSGGGREVEALRVAVPLVTAPAPPAAPGVTYTEDVIDITWELPPGARSAVQVLSTSPGGVPTGSTAAATSSATVPLNPASNTVGQTATGPAVTSPVAPPGTTLTTPSATPPGTTLATPSATPPSTTPATSPVAPPGTTPATSPISIPATTQATTPVLPILASRPIVEWPPASRYDLYEVVESPDGLQTIPQPLNMTPLTVLTYADRRVEFGLEHCYAVRTLDVVGGLDVRSGLSAQTCVTLVDTFSPAAPQGLTAVGSEGAVSLIWRPNDEEDLAGYLVLRGLPAGETLQPLILEPVQENTYRDATAEPGVRYVYAVRAVDTATPPNLSPLSSEAGDAAR